MNKLHLLAFSFGALFSLLTQSSPATLWDRGGGLVYDDVLDITWLQDGNYAETSGHITDRRMTWYEATAWADGLVFSGYDDWRLTSMDVNGDDVITHCRIDSEIVCRDNELSYMYFHNFDAGAILEGDLIEGRHSTGDVALHNIAFDYWASTEFAPNTDAAFALAFFETGEFVAIDKNSLSAAWAVRDGDVGDEMIVTINIKHKKSQYNKINLKTDKYLKIAILGDAAFDALQVNTETLRFGLNGIEADPIRFNGQDFNHDGYSDLIFTFKTEDSGIACGDTSATLTGVTIADPPIRFRGTDNFVVECL